MSILSLIASEQARQKMDKGYTPLPEEANWWDTLDTSASNIPNVIGSTTEGIISLIKDPEQAWDAITDLSWDDVDSAIEGVKDILTDERKAKEFISQNPDVAAGGIWGATKLGKFVAPKGAEMTEKMLENQGLIKHIVPPNMKTFAKDDPYTSTEYRDLGKDVGDRLSDAAHKFRGDRGYMSVPGHGKGISDSTFTDLIEQKGLAMNRVGVKDWEETMDLLQEKVGLDRLEEMLAGSAVILEKPLYIERAEGFGGGRKAKKTPVDVQDDSIYSATVVDPGNKALMSMGSPYGDNPYIVRLEPGTKIYHPGGKADLDEVVVKGKDINKSQGIKKSDLNIKDERKYGDTLFDWDEIDKQRNINPGLLSPADEFERVKNLHTEYKKGFNQKEIDAAKDWVTGDYKEITDTLLDLEKTGKSIDSITDPDLRNTILNLSAASNKHSLEKASTMYRGLQLPIKEIQDMKPGSTLKTKAPSAGSFDKEIPKAFMGDSTPISPELYVNQGNARVMYKINMPEGTKGVFPEILASDTKGSLPGIGKEFLLPTGTTLKVNKVSKKKRSKQEAEDYYEAHEDDFNNYYWEGDYYEIDVDAIPQKPEFKQGLLDLD